MRLGFDEALVWSKPIINQTLLSRRGARLETVQMLGFIRPFSKFLVAVRRGCTYRMSSNGPSHVERTQNSTRNDVVSEVTVTDVQQLSPSVKGFTLHASDKELTFKPGQWVDLHVPSVDMVGGYSITSPPHRLREGGTFNLAIQYSDHAPTLWMTTKCQVGNKLSVRVGGDFWYSPPSPWEVGDLLLIGGGVGINPLFSMLQHHVWMLQSPECTASHECNFGAVHLLYSSKTISELLFKQQVDKICADCSHISAHYFVTKEESGNHSDVACRRMQKDDIGRALSGLDVSRLLCFICGPPPMIEDVQIFLRDLEVDSGHIHIEKWW